MEVDGEKMRRLREGLALSLNMLADRAGVSRDTILALELGKRGAHGMTIHKIAHALNVDPRDILKKQS